MEAVGTLEPLLRVEGLTKTYASRRLLPLSRSAGVKAVDDVSFTLAAGSTLGIVGESGSGKSTTARLVLRSLEPDDGTVVFDGVDITRLRGAALRSVRLDMQMIFQDPYSSLDPMWTVRSIIGEPLRLQGGMSASEIDDRVAEHLELVALDTSCMNAYPYQFSGGQRQRIAIARAIVSEPKLVICDEAVSSLDVSTQAAILGLLQELQTKKGLSYLFIAHDLDTVRTVSDQVGVMYRGRLVEIGPADQIYRHPQHPHTVALLEAILSPDPRARRRSRHAG